MLLCTAILLTALADIDFNMMTNQKIARNIIKREQRLWQCFVHVFMLLMFLNFFQLINTFKYHKCNSWDDGGK